MFQSSPAAVRVLPVEENTHDDHRRHSKKPILAEDMVHYDPEPPQYTEIDDCKGAPTSSMSWFSLKEFIRAHGWNPRRRNDASSHWKPITLKAPALASFILVSLSIIVVLEILSHISSGNGDENGGGLAFASDGLSSTTVFCFLYLPTILAIFYSMAWSWVDLDAKRLEPWFQLSKSTGAAAEDSILLQYPFDFLPFIPITAFKRKHWSVFCAGTIMLLVFWVITPLQSAIFNTGLTTRSLKAVMGTSSILMPLELQPSSLSANFLNTAYGISWLGQRLPPFTTYEVAFPPFQPNQHSGPFLPSETWSTTADAYSTSLNCTPANVVIDPLGYTLSNDRGCSISGVALADTLDEANYMILYVGYYDDPHSDWALQNPNCTAEFSNNFLALWASNSSRISTGIYRNLTALFCEPSYHVQEMSVKINAINGSVSSHEPISLDVGAGPLKNVFNISNFEYMLGVGAQQVQQRTNYPDTEVLEQYPQLASYDLTWPVSNMVGFAVALNSLPIADLASPDALHNAFEKAHQLLFAVAFNTLLISQNSTNLLDLRDGIREDNSEAIIMVRSISIVVEAALGLTAALTACLWYLSHQRASNLASDPASLADTMSLTTAVQSFLLGLKDNGTMTASTLARKLSYCTFYLKVDGLIGQPNLHMISECSSKSGDCTITLDTSRNSIITEEHFNPVRPKELRLVVGWILAGILCLSLAIILFLEIWSLRNNGISLPSDNPVVLSIVENYLPTTFATLLEPAWVILNRLLCLLQPFDELRKGNAKSSSSIDVKYTSLPPQLVILRAIKSSHFLLAAVCVIAVSTNVLAVALSGLIVEQSTTIVLPIMSNQNLAPRFNGTPIRNDGTNSPSITYFDHFYVEMSNLTDGTTLPPWIDTHHFYLPFNTDSPPAFSGSGTPLAFQGVRGSTTGFGAQSICSELSPNQASDNSITFRPDSTGSQIQFTTSHILSNGDKITCVGWAVANSATQTTISTNNFTTGPSALEAISAMVAINNTDDGGFCSSLVVVGWARINTSDTLQDSTPVNDPVSLFIGCNAKLVAAQFDVLVDLHGHVLQAQQTSEYSFNSTLYFSGNSSELELFREANILMTPTAPVNGWHWHNDSFTSDWLNSLVGYVENSDDIVNPLAPLPESAKVIDLVQDMYQRLFAILLGLNTHIFADSSDNTKLSAAFVMTESRLFISQIMFKLAVVILALQLIVAVLYYTHRPKRFLPRMPTSIASIISFVSASRALDDFAPGKDKDRSENHHRYGYGRFIGTDGKTHVGIERQRYVIPLKSRNPEVKRRKWALGRWKEDDKAPKSWI